MARDELKTKILSRMTQFQDGNSEPVWVSGRQLTELIDGNPSSIRMALLLLCDDGKLIRERRKGRGPKGRTGQSAWYALNGSDNEN